MERFRFPIFRRLTLVVLTLTIAWFSGWSGAQVVAETPVDRVDPPAENTVRFDRDVQPILRRHCDRCHGSKNREAGLQLNRRDDALDPDAGIVVPGDSRKSLLIRRLTDPDAGDLMPLDGQPLAEKEIAVLARWIDQGAEWPESLSEPRHWAYEPLSRPQPPSSPPIDAFVAERLAEEGLGFSPPEDRARLLRRVSLALIGLPPTPEETEQFLADRSVDAYERVVDRLLQSERFGERWAVPWLDLARYADSNGFQADQIRDNWAYRDWLIRALNDDLPFDRFVIEQLAGDLLPDATVGQRVATGFHRMTTCNVEAGVDPEANRVDQVVDRVNTTATVFMGTTLECAQCHDHKYDPFSQQDYYRLFAYFNNTPIEVKQTSGVTFDFDGPSMELPLEPTEASRRSRLQARIAALECDREQVLEADGDRHGELDEAIAKARQELQRIEPNTTLVMIELPQPRKTFVMERGDYESPKEQVEPGTPSVLPGDDSIERTGDRLELARWLTSPANPLLARVTVNRWWAELFGTGIVSTPEDFGSQAESPSHPRLLDWLAFELIDSGWSMKHVLRQIVTSATFRQSSRVTPELLAVDPDNRWLTRGPRFRLTAEFVRDNALAISGLLSDRMTGTPVMPFQPDGLWRSVGRNQPKWVTAADSERFRRGVYVVFKRAAPYPSFVTFDAPDRASCTVQRPRTNTPLQALTLLNDPAYAEMALAFADRVLRESAGDSDRERLDYAFRLAVARPPTQSELEILSGLLRRQRETLAGDPDAVSRRTEVRWGGWQPQAADRGELAAWFAITNALLNLDETISL